MTFKINNNRILSVMIVMLAGFSALLTSCRDDSFFTNVNEYVPDGEPAMVSLTVTVPDMTQITRASGIDPDSDNARKISDLWVGIYNVNTGVRVGSAMLTEENLEAYHANYGIITINNIPAFSGTSRIVGVANARGEKGGTISGKTTDDLWDLLEDAETWEEFNEVIAVLPASTDLMRFSASVMCGVYASGNYDKNNDHVNMDSESLVNIYPGMNDLKDSGRIHLRRLDSYIKFNVTPASNIRFNLTSWQVCNIPEISYVNEHTGDGILNAADVKIGNTTQGNTINNNYHNGDESLSFDVIHDLQGNPTGGYTFDFYQMENKHTGIIKTGITQPNNKGDNYYAAREIELKNNDGEINTGWYASLVERMGDIIPAQPTYDTGLINNNASYVVLKGNIEYYYDKSILNRETGLPTYVPVPTPINENPNIVLRTATVEYVIHLGYCEGNGIDKANDFNCYRNTKYTYNITIEGVDKIRMEAMKEGEFQPGASGSISDLDATLFRLDSHYSVINIALTDQERENLAWRIQAPFEGKVIDMIGGSPLINISALVNSNNVINLNDASNSDVKAALSQNQFYNWIQIRPTSGSNIIAHYPGDPRLKERKIRNDDTQTPGTYYSTDNIISEADFRNVSETSDGIWYLNQFADPRHYPHSGKAIEDPDMNSALDNTIKRWYTIFIDEYVYEYDYDASESSLTKKYNNVNDNGMVESGVMPVSDWFKYVNQPNRKLWISLSDVSVSSDGESLYSSAGYLVEQESIQSYYAKDSIEGIGLEVVNESFKGNDSWIFTPYFATDSNGQTGLGNYHDVDGLLNQYNFVRWYNNNQGIKWDNVIKTVSGNMVMREGKNHIAGTPNDNNVTYYIPDHEDDYMMACLSRNRDLNNDGVIGANEIRWYLPTSEIYSNVMMAEESLRTPLFKVTDYDSNNGFLISGTGSYYSHFVGSDGRQLWAEELASTGELINEGDIRRGKNLRCVRNVGQKMNLSPDDSSDGYSVISSPYKRRTDGSGKYKNEIELSYYDSRVLRNSTKNFIASHPQSSKQSFSSRAFKFAKENCTPSNTNNVLEINPTLSENKLYFTNAEGTINGYTVISLFDRADLWKDMCNVNLVCGQYSEEPDNSDRGTWRTPNISELAIMWFMNIEGMRDKKFLSCSYVYLQNFNNKFPRFIGTSPDGVTSQNQRDLHIRCVKDVN